MMKDSNVKKLEEQVIVATYKARQVEEEMIVAKHKAGKLEEQVSELKSSLHDFENKHEHLRHRFDSLSARMDSMSRVMTFFLKQQPRGKMKIFVKTLTGTTYAVHVNKRDTIDIVEMKIEGMYGIPSHQQRLAVPGYKLGDEIRGKTLDDYNIQDGSTVHLMLLYRGC